MNTLLESESTSVKQAGTWPAWFEAEQAAALAEYANTPFPTRTDEQWRFSDIKRLPAVENFTPAKGGIHPNFAERVMERVAGLENHSARIVIANNVVIHVDTKRLPEGVLAMPLPDAARLHEDLFRSYFMRQPVELGSHKFALLHKARLKTGVLLYVPPSVTIDHPVEIFHAVEGENVAVFPHTLVICGSGARVKVIDYFFSMDGASALACGVNDLHIESGGELEYYSIQDWSEKALAFHLNSTIVSEDAKSTALIVNLGGGFVRGESLSRMVGKGASSVMLSINPVSGERLVDQRTLQTHAAPGASSDLLYHNTLDQSARTIFAGLIQVAEGAHRTDAYQKVRNLMLSDEAEANSMPGLEILADDVRCTHGATTGEINEDELFYMQTRGIPLDIGRRMIVMGFFDSLLERVNDESIRTLIHERVRSRLSI